MNCKSLAVLFLLIIFSVNVLACPDSESRTIEDQREALRDYLLEHGKQDSYIYQESYIGRSDWREQNGPTPIAFASVVSEPKKVKGNYCLSSISRFELTDGKEGWHEYHSPGVEYYLTIGDFQGDCQKIDQHTTKVLIYADKPNPDDNLIDLFMRNDKDIFLSIKQDAVNLIRSRASLPTLFIENIEKLNEKDVGAITFSNSYLEKCFVVGFGNVSVSIVSIYATVCKDQTGFLVKNVGYAID